MERTIFHVDVNSAFLSWEATYRLKHLSETVDLRTIPSAVGGDLNKRHGIVLAKSIPAKKYGVTTGEPIVRALEKCPQLLIVPPNHALYEKSSKAFIEILKKYSPDVEQYSIDEAFLDMTGMEKLFGPPIVAANTIKDEIYNTLGFTVNIGISTNKLLAKMASDFTKPNRVHTLFPEEIREKMWPLPIRELLFVGHATESKLLNLGIKTIGQLALTDPDILVSHLKKQGEAIWNFANGRDVSLIENNEPAAKGYGNSTTIAFDVTDISQAQPILMTLAESVGRRLRKDNVRAGVVALSIRYFDLSFESHQKTLRSSTNITNELYQAACQLLEECWDFVTPIRLLGIQATKLTESTERQLSLFDTCDFEKQEKVDDAVDKIREKFGLGSIVRGSLLQPPGKNSNKNN
ncbi:MAG: DNA polymerase IV [Lachnospiraceae bacterium]|nr:DNA polymerase IV [Lachnospiraceae bacterium]